MEIYCGGFGSWFRRLKNRRRREKGGRGARDSRARPGGGKKWGAREPLPLNTNSLHNITQLSTQYYCHRNRISKFNPQKIPGKSLNYEYTLKLDTYRTFSEEKHCKTFSIHLSPKLILWPFQNQIFFQIWGMNLTPTVAVCLYTEQRP